MGCTRISYTLTKLVLWAALFTVNFQQDRSTLGPASTTSKFLSIVSIVKEKDRHVWTGSKYLLKESWLYCMCYSTWIKRAMYNYSDVYTYYTHLNTLYIKKHQWNSIHVCTRIHYLLHGSIIKCFHLLKKKRDLKITTWNEPSFTSFGECFFGCSTEVHVPLMRQSVVMYQKRNIP